MPLAPGRASRSSSNRLRNPDPNIRRAWPRKTPCRWPRPPTRSRLQARCSQSRRAWCTGSPHVSRVLRLGRQHRLAAARMSERPRGEGSNDLARVLSVHSRLILGHGACARRSHAYSFGDRREPVEPRGPRCRTGPASELSDTPFRVVLLEACGEVLEVPKEDVAVVVKTLLALSADIGSQRLPLPQRATPRWRDTVLRPTRRSRTNAPRSSR